MSERTDEELRTAYIGQTEERGRRAVYNLGLADARAAHAAEVEGLRAENERLRIERDDARATRRATGGGRPAENMTREELVQQCRAVCTCPRSGPRAPTAGMTLTRPAIVVGHEPRCPAIDLLATASAAWSAFHASAGS